MKLDGIAKSDNVEDRRPPDACWTNTLFEPPLHLCGKPGKSYADPKFKPQSSTEMDKTQKAKELVFDNIYDQTVGGKGSKT
jgi:hypothetical protein